MRILHLSDIHFGVYKVGRKKISAHAFLDAKKLPDPHELARILARDNACAGVDAVVCTGDVGWSGVADDYTYAHTFLRELVSDLKLSPKHVVLLPGNHDVIDAETNAKLDNASRQDHFVEFVKKFYGKMLFAKQFPRWKRGDTHRRDCLVGLHPLAGCTILSINSAACINGRDDPVVLRPRVFAAAEAVLKNCPDGLRVLALHHHLLPFVEPKWSRADDPNAVREKPDTSLIANSARVQSWLSKQQVGVVLHGHRHDFHAREDLLWRTRGPDAHRLLIVGAGSASVQLDHVGKNRAHSVNFLDVDQVDGARWRVSVLTREITDESGQHTLEPGMSRTMAVGKPPAAPPVVVSARTLEHCHQAIRLQCATDQQIKTFVSVVEEPAWSHPSTARIGKDAATEDHVLRSFQALHPEWEPTADAPNEYRLESLRARITQRYGISHGPRMFAGLDCIDREQQGVRSDLLRPLRWSLEALSKSPTRGYTGMYHQSLDVGTHRHALPGLVGIQFTLEDRDRMGLVGMFRNLELSFWWVVNMFEAIKLLKWAAGIRRKQAGSITFFASLAEWRSDPRPIFVSTIDELQPKEMFTLVSEMCEKKPGAQARLAELLSEKRQNSSELNVDPTGLQTLSTALHGCPLARTAFAELIRRVDASVTALTSAVQSEDRRRVHVDQSNLEIEGAIAICMP